MSALPTFAERLRSLRERAGLTQEELAERAGITAHAVSALERGTRTRPYPHTIRSLAAALDLDADEASLLAASVRRRPAPPAGIGPSGRRGVPTPATPLVGRDGDLRQVLKQLADPDVRLVTLTGLGGVGKTRLALAAAHAAASGLTDDVFWVPLAEVTDAALLLSSVGHALGVAGAEGVAAVDVVTEAVGSREMLVVLDNVEQLLDNAAQVAVLLERCRGVTVLATSRAPLRLRGEREHPVLPLELPCGVSAAEVLGSAAGGLLAQRASAVQPSFAITDDNAADVAALCARVAGIPLALELMAARLRVLDPAGLLLRLQDVLGAEGSRDLPARQRTIGTTLDWSYALLRPDEQRIYRWCGVFSGGWTLDAVEAIVGGPVLDGLGRLVEHSLVQVQSTADGPRYGMLEPVLQHARSLLTEAGELGAARDAQLHWFLASAEAAAPSYRSEGAVSAGARATREEANHAAALEHAMATGQGDLAARLGWALWLHWWLRGQPRTGRRVMEQALSLPMTPAFRVRALLVLSAMAFAQGDLPVAGAGWNEALAVAEEHADLVGQAYGHTGCGLVALGVGDLDLAEDCFNRSIPLTEGTGDEWLWTLVHVWLGTIRVLRGAPGDALTMVAKALEAARRRGDRLAVYIGLFTAAQAALSLRDLGAARQQLEESVSLSVETGDAANLAYALEALVVLESAEGAHRRVPVLLGAVEALREAVGSNVYGYYKPDEARRDAAAAAARAALGQDAYDDALDEGRALDLAGSAAFALRRTGATRLRLAT